MVPAPLRGPKTRGSIAVLVALVVSACAVPPSSPPAPLTESGGPLSPVVDCGSLDLLTPEGQRIDLTGNWAAGPGIVVIRQEGACVWWVDQSDLPGEEVGESWIINFTGRAAADFAVSGEWANVSAAIMIGAREGRTTFEIDFSLADGVEGIILRQVRAGTIYDDCCAYPVDVMTRVP